MSLDIINTVEVVEALENYIDKIRPQEDMRDRLDIAYKIDNQSIIIYEIVPNWNNPKMKIESDVAKTTFIKAKGHWKIFWKRSDLKWHAYSPHSIAQTIKEFIEVVSEDKHGCFWG